MNRLENFFRGAEFPRAESVVDVGFPTSHVVVSIDHDSAIRLMGNPHHTVNFSSHGLTELWNFDYPCGLQIIVWHLPQEGGTVHVVADVPEFEHILHHLPFADSLCLSRAEDLLDQETEGLRSFQVWRQGDDGIAFKIGEPTSRRAAECLVKHYESLGHKQLYWHESL